MEGEGGRDGKGEEGKGKEGGSGREERENPRFLLSSLLSHQLIRQGPPTQGRTRCFPQSFVQMLLCPRNALLDTPGGVAALMPLPAPSLAIRCHAAPAGRQST